MAAATHRKAFGLAVLVFLHSVLSSAAQAGDDRFSWSYCAAPYPPACVESSSKAPGANSLKTSDKTSRRNSVLSPGERLACEQAVERYVASVFAYRACLSGETERAVREANRIIQIMKCPEDERYCYGLAQPAPPPARKPGGR